jgi:enoyl-CoA hydratase/carnithine racemase
LRINDMEFKDILRETSPEGILTITLNRPDRLNALSINLQEEIVQALKAGETVPKVKAAVTRGGRGENSPRDTISSLEGKWLTGS